MTASDALPAVILAGGRSSRMVGLDKALVKLGGRTLGAWCRDRLLPQAASVALNANGDPARFAALGLPVLPDTFPDFPGPLGGVLAALEWAADKAPAVVTAAVDTPFFPADLLPQLAAASDGRIAVAASNGRVHPVFACWPCTLAGPLQRFLQTGETRRVMTFLEQAGFVPVEFPMMPLPSGPLDPFFNINTPDDLSRAEMLAREFGS